MGTFTGLHDNVYVGHLDLTAHTKTVNFGDLTRQMQDATTFADGGYTCVKPGLISGTFSLGGFQDFADGALDSEISIPELGNQYPVTVIPAPTGTVSVGDTAWLSRGVVSKLNPLDGAKGDMAGVMLEEAYDTAIPQGVVGHVLSSVTTSGSDSSVTLTGPAAGESLYAALHVTAYDSLTSASVIVESDDSAGFGSGTTRITFAPITGTTSEWASVAGDLSSETEWRVRYILEGSGSMEFAVAFGVI